MISSPRLQKIHITPQHVNSKVIDALSHVGGVYQPSDPRHLISCRRYEALRPDASFASRTSHLPRARTSRRKFQAQPQVPHCRTAHRRPNHDLSKLPSSKPNRQNLSITTMVLTCHFSFFSLHRTAENIVVGVDASIQGCQHASRQREGLFF